MLSDIYPFSLLSTNALVSKCLVCNIIFVSIYMIIYQCDLVGNKFQRTQRRQRTRVQSQVQTDPYAPFTLQVVCPRLQVLLGGRTASQAATVEKSPILQFTLYYCITPKGRLNQNLMYTMDVCSRYEIRGQNFKHFKS